MDYIVEDLHVGEAMSDFNPGDGWVEADWLGPNEDGLRLKMYQGGAVMTRYWAREVSVPPLPTEIHTVIRPFWKSNVTHNYLHMILGPDRWWVAGVASFSAYPDQLLRDITGFEVLARPVVGGGIAMKDAVAQDIIERLRSKGGKKANKYADKLAQEFDVEA